MFDFDLPLFPFDSAAITVTTTVWVGVMVAVFFNLRLGWTLSALVVPGYIVPLVIARPTTAIVILVEAIVTYLIARVISDALRLHPYWSNVFGRDRFFVIVVVSVIVRALFDGWLLPWGGRLAVEIYGWNIDYRNDLQSFGLIVVALIANYFWKPGLWRGLGPLTFCTAVTWFLVEFFLVGFTNFNLGNFHLIYEDISASLMASPKAYMIVITTAWFASWINLRYAWDFNGILIPALLGLLWHDPFKIFVSMIECVIILIAATWLMSTPVFKNKAIQGGKKLVFFFTICFAFRLVLSHFVSTWFPGVAVTDAYGMGYLLTTLMAIKAHDGKLVVRMMKGTLQVSLVGAVAGSLIGFILFSAPQITPGFTRFDPRRDALPECELVCTDDSLLQVISRGKIPLYQKREAESYDPPVGSEISTFRTSLLELELLEEGYNEVSLEPLARRLSTIGYELVSVGGRHLLLRESQQVRGWGIYVVTPGVEGGMCLEVPAPVDEWATVESALCLSQRFPTRAIAIAGAPVDTNLDGSADPTRSNRMMFSVFHEVFGRQQPLQIRGLNRENSARLGFLDDDGEVDVSANSGLWIRGSFPEALNLAALEDLAGEFDIYWNDSPVENRLRKGGMFAEIFLSRTARRRLVARTVVTDDADSAPPTEVAVLPLREWLKGVKDELVPAGTDRFVPAKTEEMLYLDHEVLQPLISVLQLINKSGSDPAAAGEPPLWLSGEIGRHLRVIDCCADVVGYKLTVINDPLSGDRYIALREGGEPDVPRKGWGTYVFRPGMAEPFAVEIPRPLFESRSFDFGVNLFEHPRASALLIAGTHPRANLDGSADISKVSNRTNMFNLVRHVLLRQLGARSFLISQARAIQSPVESDIVVATDDGITDYKGLSPLKRELLDGLTADRMTYEFVDGRVDTAGYELGILMQATATQISQNKEVLSLWLSPALRTRYRERTDNDNFSAQFKACGIESFDGSLAAFVEEKTAIAAADESAQLLPDELQRRLTEYVDNHDMLQLYDIASRNTEWEFIRVLDEGSGQVFLAIQARDGRLAAILNLTGSRDGEFRSGRPDARTVSEFIRARALWLEVQAP